MAGIGLLVLLAVPIALVVALHLAGRRNGWVRVAAGATTVILVLLGMLSLGAAASAVNGWNDPLTVTRDVSTASLAQAAGRQPDALDPILRAAAARRMSVATDSPVVSATLTIPHPGAAERLALMTGPVLGVALLACGVFLVRRLLIRTRDNDPFSPAGVRDLRILAGVVGIGGTIVPVLAQVTETVVVDRSDVVPGVAGGGASISFAYAIAGVVLLALAEIWHHGAALRDDAAGLV